MLRSPLNNPKDFTDILHVTFAFSDTDQDTFSQINDTVTQGVEIITIDNNSMTKKSNIIFTNVVTNMSVKCKAQNHVSSGPKSKIQQAKVVVVSKKGKSINFFSNYNVSVSNYPLMKRWMGALLCIMMCTIDAFILYLCLSCSFHVFVT